MSITEIIKPTNDVIITKLLSIKVFFRLKHKLRYQFTNSLHQLIKTLINIINFFF
jgi:hypothetical protein